MSLLPRLAVGSIEAGLDLRPSVWGLLDWLGRDGARIQTYLSQSRPCDCSGATVVTGVATRHLDTWLMTRDQTRLALASGSQQADLSVIVGSFNRRAVDSGAIEGGQLATLCDWLAAPRIGVIDAAVVGDCRLPPRPAVDAVLADGIANARHLAELQTQLKALWGVPVIGGLGLATAERAALAQLPHGRQPPRELAERFGQSMSAWTRKEDIWRLAQESRLASLSLSPSACCRDTGENCGCRKSTWLRVAVAFDEAFCGYFPDTLDALERNGVSVQDFSPLRDEALPASTDIVYIGAGHPELFAEQLASNHCLLMALREHARSGRRIYAEGGGAAYLCRQLQAADGQWVAMAGVLPAAASFEPAVAAMRPVELTLGAGCWLGAEGRLLRGYQDSRWRLDRDGSLRSCVREPARQDDLLQTGQTIASRVHFNFALWPELLDSFLCPRAKLSIVSSAK